MKTVACKIAETVGALKRNLASSNSGWIAIQRETLRTLEKEYLPHGSGVDMGCAVDVENSNDDRIVITFSFHHMNENGYYDGWTDHKVTVRPEFDGFNTKISGSNRNHVREDLHETFSYALGRDVSQWERSEVAFTSFRDGVTDREAKALRIATSTDSMHAARLAAELEPEG